MDDLSKRLRNASPYAHRSLPGPGEALLRELVEGRRIAREDSVIAEGGAASSRWRVAVARRGASAFRCERHPRGSARCPRRRV